MPEGVNAVVSWRARVDRASAHPLVRDVLLPFLLARSALLLVGMAATAFLAPRAGFHANAIRPVDALVRWDAVHYLNVADHGYGHGSDAFFPLFPTLTRVVGTVMPLAYAGVLVANLACVTALAFLFRLVEGDHDRATARGAVWMALIFPTSFFLSAPYAESTYLACLLGAFLASREERYALATMAIWLACLSRPQGFLCATIPFVLAWLGGDRTLRRFPWFVFGAVLALGQLLLVHRLASGDPLGFLHADTVRSLRIFWTGPHTEDPSVLRVLADEGFGPNLVRRTINAGSLLLVVGVSVVEARRRRWDLASVALLSLAMPLYFQRTLFDAASMGRYALLAFPVFPWLAGATAGRNAGRFVGLVFPMLGLLLFSAFTSWIWAE